MKTLSKIIVLLVVSQLSISCFLNGAKGNGDVVITQRDIPKDFIKIDASAGLNVILKIEDRTSVKVETDENLQELITTHVKNGVLYLSVKSFIRSSSAKNVYVSMPGVNGLMAHSGAAIKTQDEIRSKELELKASSGGNLNLVIVAKEVNGDASSGGSVLLRGECDNFMVNASSGGNIQASRFEVEKCDAKASSGGNISVNVKDGLITDISSGGSVRNTREEQNLSR
ncbi:head GIN domain-containing protein [Namhaeicola litoreus]|uniref:Head GIN domain-containing protein n=1 Tax=Namhaeicola litoreus TaxID=1052145 RepID=A0ABW3Y1Z9_9FLAO